jgi:hypothetical protein
LTPGSGIGKKSGSRSGIRDEQPRSYFLELKNHFFGLKYLNSLMQIRVPGWEQFGSGMEKSRIRDKHPGSATLVFRILLSEVWFRICFSIIQSTLKRVLKPFLYFVTFSGLLSLKNYDFCVGAGLTPLRLELQIVRLQGKCDHSNRPPGSTSSLNWVES